MLNTEIYKSLKNNPILSRASKKNIDEYLSESTVITEDFSAGEIIRSPQTDGTRVGIIICGNAIVEPCHSKDNSLLKMLYKDDMFGIANLYSETQPFPSVIKAKNHVKVLFINGTAFRALIENDKATLEAYLSFMSKKIMYLNKKIATLTAGSTEKKLAFYLAENERNGVLVTSLSMSAIAEILNIGRASLYRALDSLANDGLIIRDGKNISIPDKNALLNYI